MVKAVDFLSPGISDSEAIERAQKACEDGTLFIGPKPDGSVWLLDRAILLGENTETVVKNCTLKLSDNCRDNFFRSANCGFGIEEPVPIENVRIRGEGKAVLMGADRPRSTGDSGKILADPCPYKVEDMLRFAKWLSPEEKESKSPTFPSRHSHTFGTDAGKPGESQKGDWRNIGILFARVRDFSVTGLTIIDPHCWAISLEDCSFGEIRNISFQARMFKTVDGMDQAIENQDGVDLRNGCHDIVISDLYGRTGDDVVALTAIASNRIRKGGDYGSTHVMGSDWSKRDRDIKNVIIRNILARSTICKSVRLLACETHIENVVIDGVVAQCPDDDRASGGILIGDPDSAYGRNLVDSIRGVTISNVVSNARDAVRVRGYLADSVITNVVNLNPNRPAIIVDRPDGLNNVRISSVISPGKVEY